MKMIPLPWQCKGALNSLMEIDSLPPATKFQQGNVFYTCLSFCLQGWGASVQGVSVQGDLCPGGLCPGGGVSVWDGGSLVSIQGSLSRGVSIQGIFVQMGLCPGGLCPGGLCPGALCPGDLCPRVGDLCIGVSLSRETL